MSYPRRIDQALDGRDSKPDINGRAKAKKGGRHNDR